MIWGYGVARAYAYHYLVFLKMTGMVQVIAATFVRDFTLRVTFDNSVSGEVDLANELEGDIFLPLRDPDYFRKFRVDPDIHTVVWANGADFAPSFLLEKATTPFPR